MQLTIGQLAERSGVATSAIRYYEERGLVRSTRTAGNQLGNWLGIPGLGGVGGALGNLLPFQAGPAGYPAPYRGYGY